jgi:hypothetical protein
MVKALQARVVPRLRELGFQGFFPHFRRIGSDKIDLLTFQFDKWGGGFVIEISKCPPDGIQAMTNEHIPPTKVTAWHMHPTERFRLQPGPENSPAGWFRYDHTLLFEDIYDKTAKEVLPFLEQAEQWWEG